MIPLKFNRRSIEKSHQLRSRPAAVLTYSVYAARVIGPAALLGGNFESLILFDTGRRSGNYSRLKNVEIFNPSNWIVGETMLPGFLFGFFLGR